MKNEEEGRSGQAGLKPSVTGIGCMGLAVVVGFALGFNAGGSVLPAGLNWLFGGLFGLFFGTLAFVFTGMGMRRDRGVVTETIMAIPGELVVSLRLAIEQANPVAQLDTVRVGRLDATLAELDELARLLLRQPRAGTNPLVKARLEELAKEWLDERALQEWLESVEP